MKNVSANNLSSKFLQRDHNIDIVAGIMILQMVIGHYSSFDAQKYLTFFMPWFFFKSGMYYKTKDMTKCIKDCKKLLMPLIVFAFIGFIENSIAIWVKGDHNIIHYTLTPIKEIVMAGTVEGNGPLWFLTTLMLVKIVYNFLQVHKVNTYLIIIVTLTAAYIQSFTETFLPEYLSNGSVGLFFYTIGDLLRNRQYNNKIWIPSIFVDLIIALSCMSVVTTRSNSVDEGFYIVWIIYCACGCIALNSIFKKVHYRFPILSWIGTNAMVIYTTHWFFLNICDVFIPKLLDIQYTGYERNIILYSLFIIGEIFFIQLFKHKRFSWAIGK